MDVVTGCLLGQVLVLFFGIGLFVGSYFTGKQLKQVTHDD